MCLDPIQVVAYQEPDIAQISNAHASVLSIAIVRRIREELTVAYGQAGRHAKLAVVDGPALAGDVDVPVGQSAILVSRGDEYRLAKWLVGGTSWVRAYEHMYSGQLLDEAPCWVFGRASKHVLHVPCTCDTSDGERTIDPAYQSRRRGSLRARTPCRLERRVVVLLAHKDPPVGIGPWGLRIVENHDPRRNHTIVWEIACCSNNPPITTKLIQKAQSRFRKRHVSILRGQSDRGPVVQ